MRIPPLYRRPEWQRLLAGIAVGGCISWVIFLFMFGALQEKQAKILEDQRDKIIQLEKDKSIWQEDFAELNKKNQELLTIQNISIKITNASKYNIDDLSLDEAEDALREDLRPLLAKDLNSVYKNKELVKRTIENKTITLNDKRYSFVIKEIFFYTTIQVTLEMKLAK
ncbi:sporulation membrane protein YtrI [Falsibacillus albus]|uniref:Sporulation protein n=1 Tax=Falsibacillus albus TaxID=2478915 RepID=A0A3L7K6Q9_9BACI|nr:sporulation membrane protein YtrI [Falsibacillus albus]RLQ97954.1 sporulation protein [Falsibacillus albus]